MDGFGDLVQQAQQLTADMDSGLELPKVERNLRQISEMASRMAAKGPVVGQDTASIKASLLLGSKGYDIQKISQKLEGLSAAKTFEPLEPVRDTDIQGFLKNERENALLAAIEQARKRTFEETERRHWECLENEWEREKQKILNALVGSGQGMVDFPQESESMLGESINMQGRSTMDYIEMAYARQTFVYNEQVIQGGIKPSLCELFAEVGSKLDDQNITEMWSMVREMMEVPILPAGSVVKARSSPKLQAAFVNQALKYSEQSYKKFIEATVYSNLQMAQLGGIPGTYNLVRSFLNVKLPTIPPGLEDNVIEGHPVWAMLYYCIRCGDLEAAMQVVRNSQSHLQDFTRFFQEYMNSEDRRLGTNSEREVRLLYRRAIRNGTDPYKRAVYCIIGRCDPREDHTEIADKIDDYLWIKLNQLHFEDDEASQEKLTLHQLQTLLLEEYGEAHFNAYQQPFLFFRVLFLTAQFEAAIEFLSRMEKYRCHAVHVALVLYEQKLLLQPHSIQSQLLTQESSDGFKRINIARLLMMYTRKFEVTDPREALQYFYFLRDMRTASGDSLFMSCVSELVLETREFDMLLGQLGKDGSRRPGAIDKFNGETQKIIELVAKDTENKGLLEDAVKLYDLAMNHDKVLELLNKLLTQVLAQPTTPQSNKYRYKQMAVSVAERYREMGAKGSQSVTNTFYLLLDLITFFDLYHNKNMEQAYNVMKDLKLLPMTVEDVETKVNAFSHYSDEIRRSLPDILLATMKILLTQYNSAKSNSVASPQTTVRKFATPSRYEDGGKQTYMNYLRSQARAMITFAGMIPYRMPGDTNARLVQMEVLMN